MKQQTKISLQIVILFTIAILATFIPEAFPKFFGDWTCKGSEYGKGYHDIIGCDYLDYGAHSPTNHWGWRHWIYLAMGLTLFIYNAFILITNIDNNSKNENK